MKALTTTQGTFGPFATIETLPDRYRCDNTDLPFTVVGQGEIVEADTIDWPAPPVSAEVRAAIVTAIKAERDRRKFNGVFVSGKWIHSDTYSRTQWLGMVMMGNNLPVIEWTTMDGTTINTTPALAQAVFQGTATLDTTLFGFAKALATTINENPNPASVDITTGWPATFGE